ncbi:MAG TPA: phage terminase large subunit [Bryobacteraceae bacterium]|nr:phage terminase large subunit [Bryobacteraceae bacterium]
MARQVSPAQGLTLTPENKERLRAKCIEDLYFLCQVLEKDVIEQPHRELCDTFVQKREPGPVEELDETKVRLILYPRGSFKSSINVVDAVQWTIRDPDIRILVLCAERTLAAAFAEEYRNYFLVREGEPTLFQLLFPEFCVPAGKKIKSNQWHCPARVNYKKEPTLWASSIESNLPGWHCTVLKCDDVVTNVNAADPAQIEKVISKFNFARKLVDPGGYIDVVGTPYDPNDLYSFLKKNSAPGTLKVLERPAWTVRPHANFKPETELTADDVDLLFPARLTFDFLRKEMLLDPITFRSQYLIDARSRSRSLFAEEQVRAAILPWQAIPAELSYFAVWDLAYGGNAFRTDYSAGAIIGVDSNCRMYVLDLMYGRMVPSDLCFRIADFIRKYPLTITHIEDSPGAKFLEPNIAQACQQLGVKPVLNWIPIDRQKDAKIIRVAALAELLKQGRVFFSGACPFLEDLVTNLCDFTGNKNAHDDIADCLALGAKYLPRIPEAPKANVDAWAEIQRRALDELLYPTVTETPVVEAEPPADYVDYFGVPGL